MFLDIFEFDEKFFVEASHIFQIKLWANMSDKRDLVALSDSAPRSERFHAGLLA